VLKSEWEPVIKEIEAKKAMEEERKKKEAK
jgi:hypothetical protein